MLRACRTAKPEPSSDPRDGSRQPEDMMARIFDEITETIGNTPLGRLRRLTAGISATLPGLFLINI